MTCQKKIKMENWQLYLVPSENGDSFWSTYSIDAVVEGKRKGRGQETPQKRDGVQGFFLTLMPRAL